MNESPYKPDPDELGALWVKASPNGPYMTGTINGVAVVVFPNAHKTSGDSRPDWRVWRSRTKEERQAAKAGKPAKDDEVSW